MGFGSAYFYNLCGSEVKVSLNHTDRFLVLAPMTRRDGQLVLARGAAPRGQQASCGTFGTSGGSELVQNQVRVWFGHYMADGWTATLAISTDDAPPEIDLHIYLFHASAILAVGGKARAVWGAFGA